MTTEEILNEVLQSPELQTIYQLSKEDLQQENFSMKSKFLVIEIIKTIMTGQENHRSKEQIFQIIQKQIMHL
jgi:hypothetical protein